MGKTGEVSLHVRPPAFGLPTGCPKCLPSYFYLRLSNIAFHQEYSLCSPDSDELPIVNCGPRAGFSSEAGGVEEFLREEELCDLDKDLTLPQQAEVSAFKSMVKYLDNALSMELWSKDNEGIVEQIYFQHLPWPINKALDWSMRRKTMTRLGINKENAEYRRAEIYQRAFLAYESLSSKKQADAYFLHDRPTSLDAALLAHLIFVISVPLEGSVLKNVLHSKHFQLVKYAEGMKSQLLKGAPTEVQGLPPQAPSYRSRGANAEPKRKQTPQEKQFKRKGKMFILAQLAVILGYVFLSGLSHGDDDEGDGGDIGDDNED